MSDSLEVDVDEDEAEAKLEPEPEPASRVAARRPRVWRGRASDQYVPKGQTAGPKQAWVYSFFPEDPTGQPEPTRIIELSGHLFGAAPRLDILHRVVVWQRREWWQGTASTKNRSEVRGSTKKPWKQKGTGRARVRNRTNPVWRGGGVSHGPKPTDRSIRLPNSVQWFAMRVALSIKYAQGDLMIVEDLNAETHRTKELKVAMRRNGVMPSALFVDGHDVQSNLEKAVRNIPNSAAVSVADLTVYEVLLRHRLVLTRSAVALLEETLGAWEPEVHAVNRPPELQ